MGENSEKVIDGFRFMPPSLGAWIGRDIPAEPFSGHIPWTPLQKPVSETTFALMTSAGISMKADSPFDVEREKREPEWGDPTSRNIAATAREADIDVNHLHINTDYIKKDINVILPLTRFREFEQEGIIGRPLSLGAPVDAQRASLPDIVALLTVIGRFGPVNAPVQPEDVLPPHAPVVG